MISMTGLVTNENLEIIYTLTDEVGYDWKGEQGKIDRAMLTKYLGVNEFENSIFYICGPPAMLKAMTDFLLDTQIPKERIKVEEFTGYYWVE